MKHTWRNIGDINWTTSSIAIYWCKCCGALGKRTKNGSIKADETPTILTYHINYYPGGKNPCAE